MNSIYGFSKAFAVNFLKISESAFVPLSDVNRNHLFCSSDVLALPIFKQEESSLPPDNENEILPFQYVLCAATSPAVKLHDETLTYLNQGQILSHFWYTGDCWAYDV